MGQAAVTATIVFVSVFMVVGSCVVVSSLESAIGLSRDRLGADLMVLPVGASTNASSVLFTAQPVNVYLPEETVDSVAAVEGVCSATPQFFTQTVDKSCCSVVGVTRIVGIDLQSDFVVGPWMSEGSLGDIEPDEIVLGAAAPAIQGDQASILGSTFFVAGTLKETGTSVDETIFMDIESARAIAAESPYLESVWKGADPFASISCVMVQVADGADPVAVADDIMASCPGTVVSVTSEMISGVSSQLAMAKTACSAFLLVLVLLAALALAGRFSALVSSRMKELGLMRTMGVGRGGVIASVVCEIGIMTLIGAVAGILAACVASGVAVSAMHQAFSLPGAMPGIGSYALAVAAGVVFAIALDAVSLIQPFVRIMRSDPQETMAKGEL